jgi:hypothetical protein
MRLKVGGHDGAVPHSALYDAIAKGPIT